MELPTSEAHSGITKKQTNQDNNPAINLEFTSFYVLHDIGKLKKKNMWTQVRRDFTQKDYCNRAEGLVQYGKFSNHKICKLLKGQAVKDFSFTRRRKQGQKESRFTINQGMPLFMVNFQERSLRRWTMVSFTCQISCAIVTKNVDKCSGYLYEDVFRWD